MNIYNINFHRLIEQIALVRRNTPLAWLKVLVSPILVLYNDFISYRRDALYRLNHNSQVCYLKAALNDKFDNALRRITIANLPFTEPVWVSELADNEPVWIDENEAVWLNEVEDFINNADFTVLVPLDLQPATENDNIAFETKMKGVLEYYKLYSKNYIIRWV